MLPTVLLDYKSMVAHDFIVKNRKKELNYRLLFDKNHPETITLPAPSLFDLTANEYLVPLEAIHAYRNPTSATEPDPEPQFVPPRQSVYSGIRRRWPASGNLRLDISTTLALTLDIRQASHGHRPT